MDDAYHSYILCDFQRDAHSYDHPTEYDHHEIYTFPHLLSCHP